LIRLQRSFFLVTYSLKRSRIDLLQISSAPFIPHPLYLLAGLGSEERAHLIVIDEFFLAHFRLPLRLEDPIELLK
jgi:hypothetical protein